MGSRVTRTAVISGLVLIGTVVIIPSADAGIQGTVVDETATPLRWVKVQLAGGEDWEDGRWVRYLRSGSMPEVKTHEHGRFSMPTTSTRRYDVVFDRYDYGPKFITGVEHGTSMTVVLDPGVAVEGKVRRVDDVGATQPLPLASVTLRLPRPDFWYQHHTVTDEDGVYRFRASVVPGSKSKWQVVFLDKMVEIDVPSTGEAVAGPDFEVGVSVR